uniref:Uncharacterized protein n=1 Tax=viral metagenome TaxID=1070528 RepID=A0A6C0AXC3_9ZZZZ|tara:strand:+ start:1148 stop:1294 length:147 start_codon:yes stop_codon:yes gene_type:complete
MGCAQSTPLSIREEIIQIERYDGKEKEKEKESVIKTKKKFTSPNNYNT